MFVLREKIFQCERLPSPLDPLYQQTLRQPAVLAVEAEVERAALVCFRGLAMALKLVERSFISGIFI